MERKTGISLFDCLSMIDDPRQPSNGTLHDCREMLVMMIAAVLSDCDTVEEMADWARMHEAWLRRFLHLKNGIPSEDTFLRMLQILDPKQFEAAFVDGHESAERHEHVETGHGRQVIQIARVLTAQGVVDPADWPKCKTIARIDAVRRDPAKSGAPEMEQRYYLSSRDLGAVELAQAVRSHWGIENRLHWVLDVNFGEDACQLRKDHAPQNLALLRKIALNLIRTDTTCPGKAKVSLRIKRKRRVGRRRADGHAGDSSTMTSECGSSAAPPGFPHSEFILIMAEAQGHPV